MTGAVRNLLLTIPVLSSIPLMGKDFSSMYEIQTLQQWKPRYTASTGRTLDQLVRPWLTAEESRSLAGVVLDFPLFGEGQWREQPLAFYNPPGTTRVVLPIFSLKFLDDLCTSYAWLELNGYSLDTVTEYTAMLAYGVSSTGRYPPPMTALHIPANALHDSKVNELALNHLVTARLFILLHELGHIYSGQSAQNFEQSLQNEIAADAFAAKVMARTPLPPLGMLIFFMADSSWAAYPPTPGTHPLSGSRVRELAKRVSDPDIAKGMTKIGELMDDPEVRASNMLVAKSTDESTLQPRRDHLQNAASSGSGAAVSKQAFDGTYIGQLVQDIDPHQPMRVQFSLERNGDHVTGTYSVGLGVGVIEDGTVTGDMLNLSWKWGGTYGYGVMQLTRDGRGFAGTWGFKEAHTGGGRWSAYRKP
jgi:hypothetical protein